MKEKARACAIFPEIGEEQKNLLRELERKCNIEIDAKETNYGGKDGLDYAIQRNPDTYVSDRESNEVLRYVGENKESLDGIILFPGWFDRRFFLTGLPTLFVDTLPNLQLGFKEVIKCFKFLC